MSAPEGVREDVWTAIRSAALWRDASDEAIGWLAQLAIVEEYEKGSNLFIEGEAADYIAVVIKGHARAIHHSEGPESRDVVITTYWPADVIGSVAALGEIPFESDVEAVEALIVALIPFEAFAEMLRAEPGVSMSVIQELARRWAEAVNVTKRNAIDVHSRVAQYLAGLPRTPLGSDAYAVEIPIPRTELAALLGTTPETLSRSFHSLQDDGLIETHDRMIIIPDGKALLASSGLARSGTESANGR
jgi:CRP-like cAMP-binding protein